jgi:hypothetical protein
MRRTTKDLSFQGNYITETSRLLLKNNNKDGTRTELSSKTRKTIFFEVTILQRILVFEILALQILLNQPTFITKNIEALENLRSNQGGFSAHRYGLFNSNIRPAIEREQMLCGELPTNLSPQTT